MTRALKSSLTFSLVLLAACAQSETMNAAGQVASDGTGGKGGRQRAARAPAATAPEASSTGGNGTGGGTGGFDLGHGRKSNRRDDRHGRQPRSRGDPR